MSDQDKHDASAETADEQPIEVPSEASDADPAPAGPDESEKLAETHDRLLRVTAEYQNYQKRMSRELGEVGERARSELLKELLEIVDDLERALDAGEQAEQSGPLLEGVRMTHSHLLTLLARHGVMPVEAEGQPFDPRLHEALMRQPTAEVAPMTIVGEIRKGYTINGRSLRPARVVVAVEPEPEESQE